MHLSSRRAALGKVVCCLVFGSLLFAPGCRKHRKTTSAPNTTDYADNLRAVVAKTQLPILRWPNYSDYHQAVATFYDDRNYEIAWTRDLKPTAAAEGFIKAFQAADQKGLNSDDYDAWRWPAREAQIAKIQVSNDSSTQAQDTVAQFDAAMTICVMRYISDLRIGRVNPSRFNFDINIASKKYDLAEFVSDNAVDVTDVPKLIETVEPDSDRYRATEAALVRYLALAKLQAAANAPRLPDVPKGGVPVGGVYLDTTDLMARLQLEGDAPGEYPYHPPGPMLKGTQQQEPPPGPPAQQNRKYHFGEKTMARAEKLLHDHGRRKRARAGDGSGNGQKPVVPPPYNPPPLPPVYTRELSDAVKHYQHRHALNEDGRLTPETIASLNVPLTQRVVQLQDSLERWRWLPNQYVNAPLVVNLPEFVLRGYNDQHQLDFTMRVVVGKVVGEHDTPVFVRMMRYLIFRPYWNVPHDIVEKELMTHIRASGVGYLASHNFEVTDGKADVLTKYTAQQIEHGGLQVREKPGPKNSLGLVKFMFPNQYDIYLHSTPETQLFERSRRDFSHGCIRVQKPEDLAVWVLNRSETPDGPSGEWDAEKVHETMENGPDNHQVNLKNPIPIVVFYLTANIGDDGETDFFEDLYGYDQKLQQTLQHGPPYPVRPDPTMPTAKPGDTV